MYRNVFLNANYGWAFYTTNNKLLDDKTYNDPQRWATLQRKWFASGRPYREIDQVDGTPNPWLQRWLQHPAYDAFWQSMAPYGRELANIDIPVLTITGYYDDGQISALQYLKEHRRYRPKAEHYAVIGPYDHFGTHAAAKATTLRDYAIDPVAQFSTPDLVLDWMDHVFHGAPRPALLKDKINFEVMGANEWRHCDFARGDEPEAAADLPFSPREAMRTGSGPQRLPCSQRPPEETGEACQHHSYGRLRRTGTSSTTSIHTRSRSSA